MIPFTTTAKQKIIIYRIAGEMGSSGLNPECITDAVDLALTYEGAYDLMVLWKDETDQAQRDEIVADLQDEIDTHKEAPRNPVIKPYVHFDELDVIARDVMGFKKALRKAVDRWGGISKLAKATSIPQPSLSRFFNTATMPRRTTLYKIAAALQLSEDELLAKWVA